MATVRDGRRYFYLEALPFEKEDAVGVRGAVENDVHGLASVEHPGHGPLSYSTSMIVPLRYCSACGTDLLSWIDANPEGFDELAARQRLMNPEFEAYKME